MQMNASRINVPKKIFDQLMNLFGEFKYNEIAGLLNDLNKCTVVSEQNVESELAVISKICVTIADNVVYSRCAPVLIAMEGVIRTCQDNIKAATAKPAVPDEPTPENEPVSDEGDTQPE
jgi:hypothetical protein